MLLTHWADKKLKPVILT